MVRQIWDWHCCPRLGKTLMAFCLTRSHRLQHPQSLPVLAPHCHSQADWRWGAAAHWRVELRSRVRQATAEGQSLLLVPLERMAGRWGGDWVGLPQSLVGPGSFGETSATSFQTPASSGVGCSLEGLGAWCSLMILKPMRAPLTTARGIIPGG